MPDSKLKDWSYGKWILFHHWESRARKDIVRKHFEDKDGEFNTDTTTQFQIVRKKNDPASPRGLIKLSPFPANDVLSTPVAPLAGPEALQTIVETAEYTPTSPEAAGETMRLPPVQCTVLLLMLPYARCCTIPMAKLQSRRRRIMRRLHQRQLI